jgi:hypothetical protein
MKISGRVFRLSIALDLEVSEGTTEDTGDTTTPVKKKKRKRARNLVFFASKLFTYFTTSETNRDLPRVIPLK